MKYIQSFCKSLGECGCYLFCLFDIAMEVTKTHRDVLWEIEKFVDKGYVVFDKDNYDSKDNFYVLEPTKILQDLTGLKWSVAKFDANNYTRQDGDFVVEYWSATGGKSGHFARINHGYNSLEKSISVNNGRIYTYRVFRIVGY